MATDRSRNWCFTWNNPYPDERVENFEVELQKKCKYYIFGYEVGKNGTPHIQGYVDFPNAVRMSTLKKLEDKIHWEKRGGTWKQATDYCKKDGDYKEWGTPQVGPGKRTDLDRTRELIKEGKGMREILDEVNSYQSAKMAELLLKYKKVPMKWYQKEVYWYWGKTGTGKTRTAIEEAGEEVWRSNCGSLKWFDGFDGQEHVIFDDFRASWGSFSTLLNLLDGYPVNVEIKGGFRMFAPKRIWITCPTRPEDTYQLAHSRDRDGEVNQLLRRITKVICFDEDAEEAPPEF